FDASLFVRLSQRGHELLLRRDSTRQAISLEQQDWGVAHVAIRLQEGQQTVLGLRELGARRLQPALCEVSLSRGLRLVLRDVEVAEPGEDLLRKLFRNIGPPSAHA